MTATVAIAGATGYAGGEIARLLAGHPAVAAGDLAIGTLAAASSAGAPTDRALAHLPQLYGRTIAALSVSDLARHDVVFLALPHGASAEVAAELPESTLVIDCAADHRLRSEAAWRHWYGTEWAAPWPYGLPEMPGHRAELAATRRIALPGCFPTGATLALGPALAAGLIGGDIAITSVSGVSGAGKKQATGNLAAEVIGSARAYGVAGEHRHVPEIRQNLAEYLPGAGAGEAALAVSFTPVLAPMARGILTIATAPLSGAFATAPLSGAFATAVLGDAAGERTKASPAASEILRRAYRDAYRDEPFVRLLEPGIQPQTQWVVGSNMCLVQVEVDRGAGRVVVTSAIDNLTKGTAGAAIQCMNLALGFEETAGLPRAGLAP